MSRSVKVIMTNEFELEITANTDLTSHWVAEHILEITKKSLWDTPHSVLINEAKFTLEEN
jgi:hypothetical protein